MPTSQAAQAPVIPAAQNPSAPGAHRAIAPRRVLGRLGSGQLLALSAAGLIALAVPPKVAAQGNCTSLTGIPVTYNVQFSVLQGIFNANCQGCHTGGSGSGGFLVNPDVVRLHLLGPPPENGAPASVNYPGFRRVVPGRPESSLLFLKLNCDGGPSGLRMPPGSPLTVAEQALFFDWIRGGAVMQGDGVNDPGSDRRFLDDFEPYR